MGLVQRVMVGRWFTRWLLRGGPWSVAAKLAAVVLYGAWKWRRAKRSQAAAEKARELSAD